MDKGILGDLDLLAFLTQSPADVTILGEMTHADKRINPIHFGSVPADIRIRIPDQILALVECVLFECSCCCLFVECFFCVFCILLPTYLPC